MGNDNLKKVYDTLKREGYTPPEYDVFVNDMQDENNLKGVYKSLKESGYTPPEYDVFASDMGMSPAQTIVETSTQPHQPTEAEKKQLLNETNSMIANTEQQVKDFNQRVDNMQEYGLTLDFGKTKQGKKQFNSETGKLEDTFITQVGNRYTNKAVADMESRRFRESANISVGAQLRNAYKEREEIVKKLDEIAKQEDEQNDSSLELLAAASNVTGGTLYYAQDLPNKRYLNDEYRKLHAALGQIDERISTLEDEKDRQNGVDVGFWRGFGKVVGNARTWDMGFRDVMDATAMLNRGKNATKDEQSASDTMMEQAAKNQEVQAKYGGNADFWNRAGVMTGHMPAFMLDFIMTGGGFDGIKIATNLATKTAAKAIGKQAVEEMAKQGFKSYVKANGMKGLAQEVGSWTIKALGTTADDLLVRAPLMTNTIQANKTAADIADRKLGDVIQREDGTLDYSNDKTWGSAIWQGEANNIIENYSEMFGAHLDPVMSLGNLSKVANTFGAKRLSGVLSKADAGALGGIMGQTNSLFQKMGVSDYVGEVSEEYYGQLWRTMLNLDDAYMQNPDGTRTNLFKSGQFHGDIWGGMALSMGMMGAGKGVITAANYAGMKHSVNVADTQARELLGDEIWEPIRTTLDATTNENIGEVAESVVNDKEMSNDEKSAVMTYIERSMNLRGFNLAETVSKRGVEADEDKEEANEAWSDGYNITTTSEMQDANNMLELQRTRLAAQLGVAPDELDNEIGDPLTFLREQREFGSSDEDLKAVVDYANAKYVFDGMQQRADDELDSQINASNAIVDARTNRNDGMVHPATMQVDDRQVYILDGNVVLTDDGTMVDLAASDESIIIKDANTGKVEFTSPESILSVSAPINASDEKMAEEQRIRDEYSQKYDNDINGVITQFNLGDPYTLTDENGQQSMITIAANDEGIVDNGNGTVNVLTETGELVPMAKEDIQQMYDNTNMQRVAEYEMNRNISDEAEQVEQPEETVTEDGRPSYEINDEFVFRDEDGTEKRAIVQGRVRLEDGRFIPDDNGSIIEYYVEGEEDMRHSNAESLNNDIVSYQSATVPEETDVSEPASEASTEETEVPAQVEEEAPVQEAMPMTKEGDPDYYASTPTRTRSFIYDEAGLDRKEANEHVSAQLDTANKALEKSKGAALPKMGTSIRQYNEAKAKRQQKIDEAQKVVDFWNQVKSEQDAVIFAERAVQAEKDAELHDEAVKQVEAEREAKKIANAERAAVGNENPMPAITEKWNSSAKVDGMQDEIVLPNGEHVKGHYVLHESGASSASHQADNGFAKTEGFPMDASGNTVNDRDYEGDTEAQRVTRDIAGNYDQRALQTPVVVSQDGVVLSGNGRTMAGEIAAQNGTDTAYNDYLKQYAAKYGFTTEQVEQMQHPRVAFVPDEFMPYTADTFAKFNQQEMKSQNKTEHAVKLGKTVPDDAFSRIIRTINRFDTLGDFYNDSYAGFEAISELVNAGVIPQAQVAEMVDGDKLSAVGRETLENVLIGKSFEGDPNAVRMLTSVPSMRQSVIFALSEISNNLALGDDYMLKDELTEAIRLCYDARVRGYAKFGEPVSNHARQLNLFASPEEEQTVADYKNATIMMLADVLNDKRVSQLKGVIASYNDMAIDSANGQLELFTGTIKTKEDIINEVLKLLNYGRKEQIEGAQQAAVERRKETVPENGDGSQGGEGEQIKPAGKGIFGNIYTQFKNKVKDAIAFLSQVKDGVAVGALHHPVIGSIDLVWGDDKYGLKKIMHKHPEVVDGLQELIENMPIVQQSDNRIVLETDTHKAVISKKKGDEETSNWLLTAYEKKKKNVSSGSSDIDLEPKGLQNGTAPLQNVLSTGKDNEGVDTNQEASGKKSEIEGNTDEAIASAEAAVNTQPTEGQKAAGNYKMGHVKIDGYDITIENPKGSVRSKKDANGNVEWSVTMNNTYGYIRGTEGVDGDHIDVFLSDHPEEGDVFVVDQLKEDGSFDEHKVMYGFANELDAEIAYLANYSPGWKGLGKVTRVSKEDFKKWIESSHRKTKPFAEYAIAKRREDQVDAAKKIVDDAVGQTLTNAGKTIRVVGYDGEDKVKLVIDGKEMVESLGIAANVIAKSEPAKKSPEPAAAEPVVKDGTVFPAIKPTESKKEIAPRMDGYTIEARKDTRDNSDIYAVKFEERVSREEFKGQREIAKKFGGYWSNFDKKGFLFKTEEAAHDFAETIMGRTVEEVEQEALDKALEKLEEYEELMKKELEEKEAKYAELDKEAEDVTELSSVEEDDDNSYREVDDEIETFNKVKEITGAVGYRFNSAYISGETENGESWTIRVSNHVANVDNFSNHDEDSDYKLSVVVSDDFKSSEQSFSRMTDGENNWQIVIPSIGIDWELFKDSIERFKKTGDGTYVTSGSDNEIEYREVSEKQLLSSLRDPKNIRDAAERLAEELNTPVEIIEDVERITSNNSEKQKRMRNSKGWYNTKTGKIYIVLPNNLDVEDVASTVFHEVVAHKGLRELIGEANYETFLKEVFDHCKADVRKKIAEKAAKHNWDFIKATDEYLGELAEKGFEDFTPGERSLWEKLKDAVLKVIDKFLKTMKLPKSIKLGDNELRYILWRSYQNLKHGKENFFQQADDIVKRSKLKLGEYSDNALYRSSKDKKIMPDTGKQSKETTVATVISSITGTKVLKNLDDTSKHYENLDGTQDAWERKYQTREMLVLCDVLHTLKGHARTNEMTNRVCDYFFRERRNKLYGRNFRIEEKDMAYAESRLPELDKAVFRMTVNHYSHRTFVAEELAGLCGMGYSLMRRKFKTYYGTGPSEWLRRERLKRIEEDMEYRLELPLKEVAERNAFASASNFADFCQKQTGKSPCELKAIGYEKWEKRRTDFWNQ